MDITDLLIFKQITSKLQPLIHLSKTTIILALQGALMSLWPSSLLPIGLAMIKIKVVIKIGFKSTPVEHYLAEIIIIVLIILNKHLLIQQDTALNATTAVRIVMEH